MPEGDTIFKTALALRPLLEGRPVLAARARTPGPAIQRIVGSTITGVEPLGKHLVIHFSNGLALHTHLRMGGSWHRYAPGQRWRLPPAQARVVLEVPEHVVVCFNAPVAELLPERAVAQHPAMQQLGPDLLGASFDADEAVRRLQARGDWAIADALLDQRALAGIGNVFKSELLFLAGIHPWTPVRALDGTTLAQLVASAQQQLQHNATLPGGRRVTTAGDPRARGSSTWVYGRGQRPCLKCRTLIQARRQGPQNRTTYWCPTCQPPPPPP